jgi:hypothetical protein
MRKTKLEGDGGSAEHVETPEAEFIETEDESQRVSRNGCNGGCRRNRCGNL